MTGAQRRSAPAASSVIPQMTTAVASALSGAAIAGLPSGTSSSMPNTNGITVTGISMITVPETVGVTMRRNSARRADSRSWKSAETTTRVASIAGPPSATAVMHTPMKAAELPITSTWPPPIRPMRSDCNAVVTPEIATAANTAHTTDASGAPAARITTVGNSMGTATVRTASCRPRPKESAAGGLSSGW